MGYKFELFNMLEEIGHADW